MSAAERMRRLRERKRAAGLEARRRLGTSGTPAQATYSSHRLLEARSLAMHAVIARKIERDPKLLQIARGNIERWSIQRNNERPDLAGRVARIIEPAMGEASRRMITEPEREWRAPAAILTLCGILTNQERWRIYEAFRA